MEMIIAIV